MPKLAPDQRAKARRLYVNSSKTIAKIALSIGVSSGTVLRWARDDDWPRRSDRPPRSRVALRAAPAPAATIDTDEPARSDIALQPATEPQIDVPGLARRIYRAIDLNLSQMESRMKDDGAAGDAAPERNMRALGDALRSAEKLKELEPGTVKPLASLDRSAPTTPAEEDQLRMRLVDRILKLRERAATPDGDR